jgi:phosphate transport system substrate-binding protein
LQGSNTIGARLGPELAKAYLQELGARRVQISSTGIENEYRIHGIVERPLQTNIEIYVAAHGSSTSFKALQNHQADIGMASRMIKDKEVLALAEQGDMRNINHEHIIGIDGLAIIVHPSNPIQALDKKQIASIFSGEINNWAQLGGRNKAIQLYARDHKSGTWDTFKNLVLGKKTVLSEQAQRFESNDLLSGTVSQDPYGIGFVGLSAVNDAKLLAVSDEETRAIKPQLFSVATEDYPLSRRLYLYSGESHNPYINDFITWALSESGQKIVEKVGFVSQNIRALPQTLVAGAPAEYQRISTAAKRLSVNFRFAEGSARLDNKALRDIGRLKAYLDNSNQNTEKVWLVGFSDAKSRSSHAKVLSQHRALAVKRELQGRYNHIQAVIGLGSFMPVASNDDATAKSKNGRVEVWIE